MTVTLVGKLTAVVLMVFGAGTMSLPILGIIIITGGHDLDLDKNVE